MNELLEREREKARKANIKTTGQTWLVKDQDGNTIESYWGRLDEVVTFITYQIYLKMDRLEVFNKTYDDRKHKPITKEEITKMLLK